MEIKASGLLKTIVEQISETGELMLLEDFLIQEKGSIKDALKKIDLAPEQILIVVDRNGRLTGTVTDGDIRRYILSGKNLDNAIKDACNRHPVFLRKNTFSMEKAQEMVVSTNIKIIPVVGENEKVVDFVAKKSPAGLVLLPKAVKRIDIPVVIMAGGKSTRLEPFNKIFPKPLMPVGDKPIIERIIDEFKKYGIYEYYLTLNYKGEMIESYFNHLDKDYKVRFIREKEYYGTAGSLRLLKKRISDTFIVSNCDVIVQADFKEVVQFHSEKKAHLTAISSIQHHKIPYGIITFKKGGEVTKIIEKPEYTFTINAGAYVVSKEALSYIPKDKHYDMTDLIRDLMRDSKKVVTYPVNENDYIDIGQWDEYKKAMEKFPDVNK